MRTPIIEFDLRDRGRIYCGAKRNFHIEQYRKVAHSGVVQERIKNRHLVGYMGHSIRERFGKGRYNLEPPESTVIDGKVTPIPPATLTVFLEVTPEGVVRHQQEFLDNYLGNEALEQYQAKVGGFSGVVPLDPSRQDVDFPIDLLGFDYVTAPNYTHNRGYALDSAEGAEDEERRKAIAAMDDALYRAAATNAAQAQQLIEQVGLTERTLAQMARIKAENEQLIAMMSRRPDAARIRSALDSAQSTVYVRPHRVPVPDKQAALDSANAFLTMQLAELEPLPSATPARPASDVKAELEADRVRIAMVGRSRFGGR